MFSSENKVPTFAMFVFLNINFKMSQTKSLHSQNVAATFLLLRSIYERCPNIESPDSDDLSEKGCQKGKGFRIFKNFSY